MYLSKLQHVFVPSGHVIVVVIPISFPLAGIVMSRAHLIVVGGFLLHLFYPPDKWLFMRGKFSQEMTPSAPTKGGERVADLGGT